MEASQGKRGGERASKEGGGGGLDEGERSGGRERERNMKIVECAHAASAFCHSPASESSPLGPTGCTAGYRSTSVPMRSNSHQCGARWLGGVQGRDLGGGREDVVAGEDVRDVGVETAVRLEDVERPLQRRIDLS